MLHSLSASARLSEFPVVGKKITHLFNYHRLEAVYRTVEYTFDPILIAQYYREQIAAARGVGHGLSVNINCLEADLQPEIKLGATVK